MLRRLRRDAGLTQEELALRAGITPNAVGALERGVRKHPYPHTVRSLADALGLSADGRTSLLSAVPGRVKSADKVATSASVIEGTLAGPPTPLLGREQELVGIRELLVDPSEARLVTLTGIGGVGKTRLATAAAQEAADRFPDGVAFVSLAPLGDPALVVPTIARSLGLRQEQGQSVADTLRAHLREKQTLLVLDNFEHLMEAAPGVADLIGSCPALFVLATSRAPLRVRGEQEYPVSPLALPASTQNPTREEVLRTPSGRLFVERARAASPSFALTTENAPSVAAICWRLAGLPLALELAAAKARFLEPTVLLSRLDQALSTAWARDLPERQRTMRAALDWSYELLSEQERRLFRRLSVFAGGFTLEGAEAIALVEEPMEVLGLLGALVEQSLVVVQSPKPRVEARYGMLEPIRQYALDRLEYGEEGAAVRRLHAAFFLALAEDVQPRLRGSDQAKWSARLEREYDNFRTAFSWALSATGDAQTAARLGWTLQGFLWTHGYHGEGRRWAEATLARELPDALRARALHLAAMTAYIQGDYPAAGARWVEALRLSQRAGDTLVEAYSRAGTGVVEMARSEHGAAVSSLEDAISLFEGCDDGYMAAASRGWLGLALLALGDGERARTAFGDALEWARPTKNPALIQTALYNLSQSALSRDDYAEAGRMLEEAISLSGQVGDRISLAQYLEALAVVASSEGNAERTVLLLGAAEGLVREVGAPGYDFYDPDPSIRERPALEARAVMGEKAFEKARERGREMRFEQAIAYALLEGEAT